MATKDQKKATQQRRARETNVHALRVAMMPKLDRRTDAMGEVHFRCVPSLLDHYVEVMTSHFTLLGRRFSEPELEKFKEILQTKLEKGFATSPYARIIVKFHTEPPPHPGIQYTVSTNASSIGNEYENWVKTREPPLFGKYPDAKVMVLARQLGTPADVPVLDVGAGTGRNTLPIARLGHPTDAVEIAPALAEVLRKSVKDEGLAVEVFEGDVLDSALVLPQHKYKLVVLAEVVASHFQTVEQIRTLATRMCDVLAPDGVLVFSAFVAMAGYKPDAMVREVSHVAWCCVFTRQEIDAAMEGLPLERVADESVHDFERDNLPKEAWPPTGWFINWTQGLDLFALPAGRAPVELRWLTYKRRA
jgi:2-polyprenyl-3-methyl-5-hydroxy-6-metoxy-1,4-benzoquinol methylase